MAQSIDLEEVNDDDFEELEEDEDKDLAKKEVKENYLLPSRSPDANASSVSPLTFPPTELPQKHTNEITDFRNPFKSTPQAFKTATTNPTTPLSASPHNLRVKRLRVPRVVTTSEVTNKHSSSHTLQPLLIQHRFSQMELAKQLVLEDIRTGFSHPWWNQFRPSIPIPAHTSDDSKNLNTSALREDDPAIPSTVEKAPVTQTEKPSVLLHDPKSVTRNTSRSKASSTLSSQLHERSKREQEAHTSIANRQKSALRRREGKGFPRASSVPRKGKTTATSAKPPSTPADAHTAQKQIANLQKAYSQAVDALLSYVSTVNSSALSRSPVYKTSLSHIVQNLSQHMQELETPRVVESDDLSADTAPITKPHNQIPLKLQSKGIQVETTTDSSGARTLPIKVPDLRASTHLKEAKQPKPKPNPTLNPNRHDKVKGDESVSTTLPVEELQAILVQLRELEEEHKSLQEEFQELRKDGMR